MDIYVRPVTLSKCGHTFCCKCGIALLSCTFVVTKVQTWLAEHSTCPECRAITYIGEIFQNRGVQSLCDKVFSASHLTIFLQSSLLI